MIYFGSHDGYLYAVDVGTGQDRWKVYAAKGDRFQYMASSSAIAAGVICLGVADGNVIGVDIWTGQKKWRFNPLR